MMFEKINIFNRLIVTWNLTKKKGGEGDRKNTYTVPIPFCATTETETICWVILSDTVFKYTFKARKKSIRGH